MPWLASPTNPESPLPFVPNRPTVNPVLPVHDMAVATAFYRSIGFTVSAYDAGYAWVGTCGWEFLHLVHAPSLEAGVSSAGAYVHVGDVTEWHTAMCVLAPDETGDVADQPWGMREYAVTDPSGNVIRFGHNL